ncbi:prolyl oligopeptidase family serine peptidase (plasmid) [Sphingomonas changnyeongensis]|uniref:Prolyl oligopeptidase family serine peptidase n=1 Tax=Sphingomonas changnyeongensis TaxID=2698679 RepID=A0A7Z2S9U0_9SPHN|nr:prolyl oligopeptidase family serine peptidase [Sphingomonas changnyeongensis]
MARCRARRSAGQAGRRLYRLRRSAGLARPRSARQDREHGPFGGGWLVGAALNRAPDLWAGVVADVPFVDVLTTLLGPARSVAAAELSEVGDVVNDAAAFARVLRLCAYQNILARRLPPVYLTASLADVRIPWGGVLKYVARLRAAHPNNAVALRLDRDGNHWGPADPEKAETWRAERVAFVLRALGVL